MTLEAQKPASLDNFKPMLAERGELADLIKKCEERVKELDADLRPVLEGRGEVVTQGYSFNVKLIAGRKTTDKESLEAFLSLHGKTMADFEKQGAPYTTFTVKKVQSL